MRRLTPKNPESPPVFLLYIVIGYSWSVVAGDKQPDKLFGVILAVCWAGTFFSMAWKDALK